MEEYEDGGHRDRGSRSGPRRSFGGRGGSGNGGGNFRRPSFGPREMHKATCSECGAECEVPFKPKEGKPVYCKECYRKRQPQ